MKPDQQETVSAVTTNITEGKVLQLVSTDSTMNVTHTGNLIMDAFYYLFGWK